MKTSLPSGMGMGAAGAAVGSISRLRRSRRRTSRGAPGTGHPRAGVSVAYHGLNDFHSRHGAELDYLVTQVLAYLMRHDLIDRQRVAPDGTRVRASATSRT